LKNTISSLSNRDSLNFFLILFVNFTSEIAESTDIFCAAWKLLFAGTQEFFEAVTAVVGESFFVADFQHGISGGVLHDTFKAVCDVTYEEGGIFVCKAAARRNVSVGMNVEDVTRALTVIFLKPAAGLPGA
jgi:hypothetical protein